MTSNILKWFLSSNNYPIGSPKEKKAYPVAAVLIGGEFGKELYTGSNQEKCSNRQKVKIAGHWITPEHKISTNKKSVAWFVLHHIGNVDLLSKELLLSQVYL